jgi:hypothetical protein
LDVFFRGDFFAVIDDDKIVPAPTHFSERNLLFRWRHTDALFPKEKMVILRSRE